MSGSRDPLVGREIASYLITESLGDGGPSSRLYRAEDRRLGRSVVLRVFAEPRLEAAETDRLKRRFVRQAKAASSLDHPNICSVFEIAETPDGRLFTVLPFYEGRDFSQVLADAPIPAREAVAWICQAAEGLAKAHDEGFIHGHLRPENLMITSGDVVKILDLGIAPYGTEQHIEDDPYKAPELHRGHLPIAATDQWALARLTRHLLTGTPHPTEGDELTFEPQDLDAGVAGAVLDVLGRAESDLPEGRYRSIRHFADGLSSALGAGPSCPPSRDLSNSSRAPKGRRSILWPVIGGTILVAGWLTFDSLRDVTGHSSQAPKLGQTHRMTSQAGLEKAPAWSPDGLRVAYTSDEDGDLDIMLRDLRDDRISALTADYSGYDDHPIFSPDGRRLVFVSDRDGGGIFSMRIDGSDLRRVAQVPVSHSHESQVHAPTLAFATDGELIFAGSRGAVGLFRVPDGASETTLDATPVAIPLAEPDRPFSITQPAISPDGGRIAFTELTGTGTSVTRLWHVARDGSDPIRLTDGTDFSENPVWSDDGRGIYFLSDRRGNDGLTWLPLDPSGRPAGEPVDVTVGFDIGSFALSPEGRRLVYSKVAERSNIWSAHMGDDSLSPAPSSLRQGQQLMSENQLIEFVDVSPDGQWLAFDSNRSGNVDIWLFRLLDRSWRRLTADPAHDWRPRFSPDGKQIVFYSLRSGERNLWIVDFAGGPPRRLTDRPETDWMPIWSPDGTFIAFDSVVDGIRSIYRVAPEGGAPQRVSPPAADDAMYPLVSPASDAVLYTSERPDLAMELLVVGFDGDAPRKVLKNPWAEFFPLSWQEDGWVYGLARPTESDAPAYWAIRVSDGEARRILRLENPSLELVEGFAVSQRTLYFPIWELRGDVWIGELGSVDEIR